MRTATKGLAALGVLVYLVVVAGRPAAAYIDPGTGGFLFQLLVGGVMGAVFAVGVFWKRVTGFFARLFGRKPDTAEAAQQTSDAEPSPATPEA